MIYLKNQLEYFEKIKEIITKEYKKPLAYIETFGCKLNENDSEKIAGMLKESGYEITDDEKRRKDANFIIFNTCCIRENAEEKLFGRLR